MKKKTLVLGLGLSGTAAAEFLLEQKKATIGIDSNRNLLQTNEEIRRLQAKGLLCQHDQEPIIWEEIELLVVSPGISQGHPIYQLAIQKGIKIIGEAELALPYFDCPLVGVTGTNGKTTVTLLVEHILNSAGIRAKALGNIGKPLCAYLLQPDNTEAFVVELSSYQLETMQTPVFDAAALLNITPDHLDRYANMQEYAQAKFRLQDLLKPERSFYIQSRTAHAFSFLLHHPQPKLFGLETQCHLYCDRSAIYCGEKIEFFLPLRYREMGEHDFENILAAWALCRPFCVTKEQFSKALETFNKPPHRIEFVEEIEGVLFYDDSKGTNIDAVIQAVKAMKNQVILIAGGLDKGASYLLWKDHFLGKVKQIIAIGQAAPKIYNELHPYFNIKLADSLASAVKTAAQDASRGDSVLLSPGCSSYDMFRHYAHRGEEFQRYVRSIEGRRGS
jgi:UDP-N-acetylmuramoylalanine--D-glutamate ligase